MFKHSREVVEVKIGQPISFSRLKKFKDDESLTQYLRLRTFILGQRSTSAPKANQLLSTPTEFVPEPFSSRQTTFNKQAAFDLEVERLRASGATLTQHGQLSVLVAAAPEIPHLLRALPKTVLNCW